MGPGQEVTSVVGRLLSVAEVELNDHQTSGTDCGHFSIPSNPDPSHASSQIMCKSWERSGNFGLRWTEVSLDSKTIKDAPAFNDTASSNPACMESLASYYRNLRTRRISMSEYRDKASASPDHSPIGLVWQGAHRNCEAHSQQCTTRSCCGITGFTV